MIRWDCKKFTELSPEELYAILQLRNEVFVVEQNCVYQDADNKDQESFHFMGWQSDRLIAYTRLLPAGKAYALPSIGRVVTSPSARRTGLGRELMLRSLEQINDLFGPGAVQIGAQLYLKDFYIALGFAQTSDVYLEDGIEHIEMVRPTVSS